MPENNLATYAPDVTVIVPVRNRAHLLVRCLDSIAAQTARPSRVIVVDNGSTDGSADVARRWAGEKGSDSFRVDVMEEPGAGAARARNRGLDATETEYVIFFDSDDAMCPNLVERALAGIAGYDLVYWKALETGPDSVARVKKFSTGNVLRAHFFCGVLCTVCFMARTSLVRKAGGWCDDAMVWNDWELGLRMLLEHPRAKALPEILTMKYAQNESITGTAFSQKAGAWENTLAIVRRVIRERARRSGFSESALLGMADYRGAVLAAHYHREGNPERARALMADTLAQSRLPVWKKLLLRAVFQYTRLGGRGAYLIW